MNKKGTSSIKETCAPESIKETCAGPLCIPPTKASLYTRRPFLRTKGNRRSFMRIHQMEDTWQLQSPRWLQKRCVIRTQIKDKRMVEEKWTQLGQYC